MVLRGNADTEFGKTPTTGFPSKAKPDGLSLPACGESSCGILNNEVCMVGVYLAMRGGPVLF